MDLLIKYLGILRGVSFSRATEIDSFEAHEPVVELNADLLAKIVQAEDGSKNDDMLTAAIAVYPDLTSQQISIEQAGVL